MAKAMRRDQLKRLAMAGRLVQVKAESFNDATGASESQTRLPVRYVSANTYPATFEPGVAYLFDCDFTSKTGRAWVNSDGTVSLRVHSSSFHEFEVVELPTTPTV